MEGFFQICISFGDEIEVKELILRRYYNADYIFSMECMDFLLFLQKAREKELEEQIRCQWNAYLPYMNPSNYVSFQDYYNRCTGKNIDRRNVNEIIRDIEDTHRRAGKEVKIYGV